VIRLPLLLSAALLAATPAAAQTAPQPAAADWRAVEPQNLLVIETSKGRVLVELEPRVAPAHVARIRELADRGFYDGLKFHRVIAGFMAQTGDPKGDGTGGSDLPDIAGEFGFRRGRTSDIQWVEGAQPGLFGLMGSVAVSSQPDSAMMINPDFKAGVTPLFCPGSAGMARSGDPNSANSQFFLMTGENPALNGGYTVFGRIVDGLAVVRALNSGSEANNGQVTNPDVMTRVRTASALPAAQRPAVRVLSPASAAFAARLAEQRARSGRVNICDVQPVVEISR